MWGSFHHILTPVRDCSPRIEQTGPSTPQDTVRGQLNKGWVPLSEHLPRDYNEVLTRDWLHCLETMIAHALAMHSTSLPNCLPLLQEVDIRTHVQLTSAQSDATAWYMVLGMYAILASHINNLTSRPACGGLFPEPASTSTPQPLPPIPSKTPPPPSNTSLSTTLSIPAASPPLPSPVPPLPPPPPMSPPLPLTLPLPPPPFPHHLLHL